jgi:FAD/FMN-containing dehydrogenase
MKSIAATLRSRIAGAVIGPTDAAYDEARAVHNGMIDKKPDVIVRAANVDDVGETVRLARDLGLAVAIRGGGHSGPGFGTSDGGIVLDLAALREVTVNPDARTVQVGGGATWADVDAGTEPFGLSVPCGVISSTGVGGLALGGGHGYLTRAHGLTIDNILAADMVLADGRIVTTSPTTEPDLFWAIRGGGGNFGVVTRFTFRAHPVSTVIAGPMLWSWDDMPAMMRYFVDHISTLPDQIYGFFAELIVPPGPPFPEPLHLSRACAIVWCSTLPADETAALLAPFRAFRKPIVDFVGPMPLRVLNGMFDVLYPKGTRAYWKGDFFDSVPDEVIALHEKYGQRLPGVQSTMHLYPIDGAAARVPADATAWGHRDARFSEVILGADAVASNDALVSGWARDYWMAVHPYSCGAAYVNFMMGDEGQERVQGTYKGNFARLASIKQRYDPDNVFRINHNILPV